MNKCLYILKPNHSYSQVCCNILKPSKLIISYCYQKLYLIVSNYSILWCISLFDNNVKQFNIKTPMFSNEILQKVSSSKFLLFSEYRNIGVDRLIIRKVKIIFSFACLASFRIYIRGNFRFSTFVLCAKTNL